jgi:hypothetical protein
MAVAEAQLKEFLLRDDVPDEDKTKAVELYKQAKGATAAPTEAAPAPAAPINEVSAAVEQQKKEAEAAHFDPGGSAHGDVGTAEIVQGVQEKQSSASTKATLARTVLPIAGGLIGAILPIPGGAAMGAAIGAGAGDWIAQDAEIESGLRQAYNPLRTGGEMITAGYFSKYQAGKTLMQAAVTGALGNMASDTFINLTEGKGLPSTFDLAVSGLTGMILSGAGHKGEEIWQARKAAAREITGSDEVATRLANFIGPTQTGEQLELRLKAAPKQLELGLPAPETPQPPFVGPTQDITKPGKVKVTAAQTKQRKQWSDQELTDQFGFDDIEEGRTFEKLFRNGDPPDQYSLNLKEAKPTGAMRVAQASTSEADEFARMEALGRGKKEMLDTPMDRDAEWGDVSRTTKGIMSVGRPKDVAKRLEMDTNYPVYQDYHDSSQAYRAAQKDVSSDSREAGSAIKGTDATQRNAIFQAFMNGGDFSRLPSAIQKKASTLWAVADKQLAEYDLTAAEYFSEYLPQVAAGKSMKQIIEEGTATSMIPNRMRFAEDAAEMLLSPQDPSLVRVMNKLIDAGAYRRHVADIGAELKLKYGAEGNAPEEVKDFMNGYLASLKGSTGDPSAETVDNVFGMIASKLGMKISGTELSNKLIGATYTGLMGYRPSSIIRNAMQTIQTGIPLYGVKSFTAGLKGALTAEGRATALAAGVIDEGNVLHDIGRSAGKITKGAFWGFQKVENFNRTVSYLAGLDKFDRALGKASKGGRASWSKLMDKADIDMLSEPEIEVLSKMWDAGEPIDKIKHVYAQGIVDDTQFMYLMPERAKVLQSQSGRMVLGYANWSQGYASYVARMVGQGPPRKRVRQTAMWLGTNAVLAGAFAKVGGMFGDDDSFNDNLGWTFAGPLFYAGGPILTTAQSLSEQGRKMYQGQVSLKAGATQMVKDVSTFVPFGGVTRDIFKAAKEPNAKEMMGRFLGFKRGRK